MIVILKVDLFVLCVIEYWCKIICQQIIFVGFFYFCCVKKGTYDLDNDDGLLYEWCLCGIYVGCFYDGGGWGVIGFYIEFIFEL